MEMKENFRKMMLGFGLLGLLALPAAVSADNDGFRRDLGEDDRAHYNFSEASKHRHPNIWKTAMQLRMAKHTLWEASYDFRGHKAAALKALNTALDELRICEGM